MLNVERIGEERRGARMGEKGKRGVGWGRRVFFGEGGGERKRLWKSRNRAITAHLRGPSGSLAGWCCVCEKEEELVLGSPSFYIRETDGKK